MEFYPPEPVLTEPALRTWRDRFELAGILFLCLTLAVGLEHGIQALYRRHQLNQLRAGLLADGDTAIVDCEKADALMGPYLNWLETRLEQIDHAIRDRATLPPSGKTGYSGFEYPQDFTWRAARSSGLAAFFPSPEAGAYSEIDSLVSQIDVLSQRSEEAHLRRSQFENEFIKGDVAGGDYSGASPEDLLQYQARVREEIAAYALLRFDLRELWGAELALIRGVRNRSQIVQAEGQIR